MSFSFTCIPSLIFPSTYYVPGTVLCSEDTRSHRAEVCLDEKARDCGRSYSQGRCREVCLTQMGVFREASLEEVILKKEKGTTRQINRRWGGEGSA